MVCCKSIQSTSAHLKVRVNFECVARLSAIFVSSGDDYLYSCDCLVNSGEGVLEGRDDVASGNMFITIAGYNYFFSASSRSAPSKGLSVPLAVTRCCISVS